MYRSAVRYSRVMRSTFVLMTTLGRPPLQVWDHLSRPENYLGLQVLLTEISPVTEAFSASGKPERRYTTVETFRWLGLPLYRNRIAVALELTDPGRRLVSRVRSAPNLTLEADYRFDPAGAGCRLTLGVTITVAGWLSGWVTAEARRVQGLVLERLKERLG